MWNKRPIEQSLTWHGSFELWGSQMTIPMLSSCPTLLLNRPWWGEATDPRSATLLSQPKYSLIRKAPLETLHFPHKKPYIRHLCDMLSCILYLSFSTYDDYSYSPMWFLVCYYKFSLLDPKSKRTGTVLGTLIKCSPVSNTHMKCSANAC